MSGSSLKPRSICSWTVMDYLFFQFVKGGAGGLGTAGTARNKAVNANWIFLPLIALCGAELAGGWQQPLGFLVLQSISGCFLEEMSWWVNPSLSGALGGWALTREIIQDCKFHRNLWGLALSACKGLWEEEETLSGIQRSSWAQITELN